MADYTIHLGYNLESSTIGAVWAEATAALGSALADKGFRFLQYALSQGNPDSTDTPAWFTSFQNGDNLYFRIWDLSATSSALPINWIPRLSLSALIAATTYDPSSYLTYGSGVADDTKVVNDAQNHYLEFTSLRFAWARSDSGWDEPGFSGPWGPCRGRSVLLGPLTFKLPDGTTQLQCKLSFYLATITDNNDNEFDNDNDSYSTDVFLGDPEVIVSSTG